MRRIRGLLDKAEATEFEAEREALVGKATDLMAEYRISELMLASNRPTENQIVTKVVELGSGPYVLARLELLFQIAQHSGCKITTSVGWEGREAEILGFEADVAGSEALYTSLLVQATTAMGQEKPPKGQAAVTFRRNFLMAFALTVGHRVETAHRNAMDTIEDEADRSSVAVVLVDRRKRVDDELLRRYGKLRKMRGSNATASSAGRASGQRAGGRADIGSARLPEGRKAIGTGA